MNDVLRRCLDDLEARIDPQQEEALLAAWRDFAYDVGSVGEDRFHGPIFSPRRARPAPPAVPWPKVPVNAALEDFDLMALQQFGQCSEQLAEASGAVLNVRMSTPPPLRFAAIGLNHGHIYMQIDILLEAGAQLVSYYAVEPELAAAYGQAYPQATLARSAEEILEDPSIQLIINAGIPCERAALGIRVMQHGKDYMTDKPGMTTFEQLKVEITMPCWPKSSPMWRSSSRPIRCTRPWR